MNIDLSPEIGVASFALSIILYGLCAVSELRNRRILKDINTAIQQWQSKSMSSDIEHMESISEKRAAETDSQIKAKFIEELSLRIKYIIEDQKSVKDEFAQSSNLKMLLDCFSVTTEPNIPKEAKPEILKQAESIAETRKKSTALSEL
ncbi:MAG: hypothetical protein KAI44_11145 [Methylococcales bacterium]|nr:hypothetical protein [Methylococcales bacterium]